MKLLLSFCALFLLTACGHHRDVRPAADGNHSIALKSESPEAGSQEAMKQAEHYCKEFDKHAVVVDENSTYSGDMDESTYKAVKTASKVGKRVGGAVFMGGEDRKKAHRDSSNVYTGAGVLDDVAGDGYSVRMRFRCQ